MIDEPKFPDQGPTYSAIKSFRIEWEADGDRATLEDEARYFQIGGFPARVRAEFAVEVPELGFSWKSDPIEAQTASTVYGFLGGEVNGQYYMDGESAGEPVPEAPLPSEGDPDAELPDTGGPEQGGFGLGSLFGLR